MSDPAGFELGRLQRWMQAVIMHPKGVEAGMRDRASRVHLDVPPEELDRIICPSRQLGSNERLSVYANAYFWRLLDILKQDFPTIEHAVGERCFAKLAERFLDKHPSSYYSLTRLGRPFAGFLREELEDCDVPQPEFLAEVAEMEWAMEELFDAERADAVKLDDLLGVEPERWAGARVQLVPAVRLMAFKYPVNDYMNAVRAEQQPPLPGPRETWAAVYRHEYALYRLPLEREGHVILTALAAGRSLGEALEALAEEPGADLERLAANVGPWFQDWTARGLFARVDLPDE
ncbi:MAG: DNA-binding domain-containing protein [Planctomycetota bacterium]|nr:DNA-binding domain-containing protein [Planctomycetota bacterium]